MKRPPAFSFASPSAALTIFAGLLAVQATSLLVLGMPPICRCGTVALWHGNPSGPETSQHLTDWYTYTHVLHGVAFYALLSVLAPRVPVAQRFLIAAGLESAWEILENTPMVMERYRQGALAQGYVGDSIVNSLADSVAAAVGFVMAWRLPLSVMITLALAMEATAAYLIRDGLILNLIQLLFPSEALSQWQARR